MIFFRKQRKLLRDRFGEREIVSPEEIASSFEPPLDASEVAELFRVIEQAYEVPAGLLRVSDNIDLLVAPIKTKNLLQSWQYEIRAGDALLELQRYLHQRLKANGRTKQWSQIDTFGQLLEAWCGRAPNAKVN